MLTLLAEQIDALLPQTQCTQCGFSGCLPYAEAIACGEAQINRCPPGGDDGIARLSQLTGKPILPLDAQYGPHLPHRVALIDETTCIGCAKCLKACPTDAIVGASKFMHTVIAEYCTGCALCIPPCPVDCIQMIEDPRHPRLPDSDTSRARYQFHRLRLARENTERDTALAAREQAILGEHP